MYSVNNKDIYICVQYQGVGMHGKNLYVVHSRQQWAVAVYSNYLLANLFNMSIFLMYYKFVFIYINTPICKCI